LRLTPALARTAFERLLVDVQILLDCGLVHGDLSAFNVLYANEVPRLIDLPQAVAIDETPDAWTLFFRDVDNLCRYAAKCGVEVDALDTALRLWQRR
jgi:RIO kinase 1